MKALAKHVTVMLGCLCAYVAVFPLPGVSVAIAQQQSEVEQYMNLGVRLHSEGKYRDALEQFNRVLAVDPENKIAKKYANECNQYLTPGAVEEPPIEYPEAPPLKPKELIPSAEEVRQRTVQKYLDLGQEYYDQGEYEKAVGEWERVLLVDPVNERAIQSIRDASGKSLEKKREGLEEDLRLERDETSLFVERKRQRPEGTDPGGIRPFRITLPRREEEKEKPVIAKIEKLEDKLNSEVGIDFDPGNGHK